MKSKTTRWLKPWALVMAFISLACIAHATAPDPSQCRKTIKLREFSVVEATIDDCLNKLFLDLRDPSRFVEGSSPDQTAIASCYGFCSITHRASHVRITFSSGTVVTLDGLISSIATSYGFSVSFSEFVVVFCEPGIEFTKPEKLGTFIIGNPLSVWFPKRIAWNDINFDDAKFKSLLKDSFSEDHRFDQLKLTAEPYSGTKTARLSVAGKWNLNDVVQLYCALYHYDSRIQPPLELILSKKAK